MHVADDMPVSQVFNKVESGRAIFCLFARKTQHEVHRDLEPARKARLARTLYIRNTMPTLDGRQHPLAARLPADHNSGIGDIRLEHS